MERIDIGIASPADIRDERQAVLGIFNRWNNANDHAFLNPVMWEYAAVPALGDHPQHILNRSIIDRCDLLVAMFWSRLGTPTPSASSGTVEEIREFVGQKGPERAMIYFCTRDLPHSIDPLELVKLREFKMEIQSQGLWHEYKEVHEFERDLYRHLDVKVGAFLRGELPVPEQQRHALSPKVAAADEHPDPRLRRPIDFGSDLQTIADAFACRMDEFRAIGGAGPDKFLDLGAHVYNSVAMCLDRFLTFSSAGVAEPDRKAIRDISTRLKHIAASSSECLKKGFPVFWQEGDKISGDLSAHVSYLKTMNRI